MDIQVQSRGTFLDKDIMSTQFRILVNSMKNPSKITSMESIRDIYNKVRSYSASTTTNKLPVFFLESYKIDENIFPKGVCEYEKI
jgi:hypothetical protein